MIVEFAGLPGAGKSTAFHNTMRALTEIGLAPRPASDLEPKPRALLTARALAVLREARFVATLLHIGFRSHRPASERWLMVRMMTVMLQRYGAARKLGASSLVVFDEGIVQRCFLALVEDDAAGSPSDVERYLRHAPRPDVVLFLDVPPRTCISRIRSRTRQEPRRLETLSEDGLAARFADAREMFQHALSLLEQNPGHTTVLRLDGSSSDMIDQIASTIVQQLQTRN